MTATQLPVRGRPTPARLPSPVPAWRLFRLELRRNPMPWTFLPLAALFVFDPYRSAMGYPAVWDVRASVLLNKMLPDFVVFVVGIAAWMGSRDGRRHTLDLVEMTPRPRWVVQIAAWAATTCWAIIGFLCGVAVLYGVTATQVTWGGPPWWPVVVGCAQLAVLAALGFAAGALFPGRFIAPLAAVAAFLLSLEGFKEAVGRSTPYAVLSPATYVPSNDAGVFYPYPPDVAIDQFMLLAGLTAVALGLLGLARSSGIGPGLRRCAAVITAVGLAATGTAAGLAGTARQVVPGTGRPISSSADGMQTAWVIPALHDAAGDRPARYTPVCATVTVPVCVHPAFRDFLPDVTAALRPVLRELAGLPGAPVHAQQVASGSLAPPRGDVIRVGAPDGALTPAPPVFQFTADQVPARAFAQTRSTFAGSLKAALLTAFVPTVAAPARRGDGHHGSGQQRGGAAGAAPPEGPAVMAQIAVQAALLLVAGLPQHAQQNALGPAWVPLPPAQRARVNAAAQRLAALPTAARHAWLATHLAALRAGQLTLAQLP